MEPPVSSAVQELRLSFAESARVDLEKQAAEYKTAWEASVEKTQDLARTIDAKSERVSALEGRSNELLLQLHEHQHQLLFVEKGRADLEAQVAEYKVRKCPAASVGTVPLFRHHCISSGAVGKERGEEPGNGTYVFARDEGLRCRAAAAA